jgi:hypothetical protein
VYASRNEFFACARLADNEDAHVEVCGNLDVSPDFPYQVGLANKSTNYRGTVYAFRSCLSILSSFWTMTICLHKVESSSMTIEKKRNTSVWTWDAVRVNPRLTGELEARLGDYFQIEF